MKKILVLSTLLFSLSVVSQNDFESSHLYKINNENIEKLKGTWIAVDRIEKLKIDLDYLEDYDDLNRVLELIKGQEHIQIKPTDTYGINGRSRDLIPGLSTYTLRVGDFNISKYDSRFDEGFDGTAEISFKISYPEFVFPTLNTNENYEFLPLTRQGYFLFELSTVSGFPVPTFKGDATAYKDRIYWSKDDRDNPIILDDNYRLDVNFCEDCVEYNYTDEDRESFNEKNKYISYKFIDDNTIEINFSNYAQGQYVFSEQYVGETLKNIKLIRVSKNDDFEVDWNSYEEIKKISEIIFELDGDYIINTPIPINN